MHGRHYHEHEHDEHPMAWKLRRKAFLMARRGRGPFGGGPFGPPFGDGPFGDDPFGGDGGPRRRHRRGDIKFALLELLAEQPRHGYDLIKELESRYAGFYRPSPGSVYPTLQLLEDEGHLSSEQVEGKRIYTITASGQALLAERQEAGEGGIHPGEPHERLHNLRHQMKALMEVVMQAARHGSPEQVKAVTEVVDNARREVHRILAG